MLPRSHRLTAAADIQAVLHTGRLIRTPWLRLYYMPQPHHRLSRVACIVSKKVHSKATIRHRYQRWLRYLARHLLVALPAPHDTVLVAQPALTQLTTPIQRSTALNQLLRLLDKAVTTSDN